MARLSYQAAGDKIAIVLSTMCAIHCLTLPVALIAFPLLATTFVGDEHFHALLMWLILPTSILALGLGCRRHKDQFVIGLGILGLSLLVIMVMVGHDLFGEIGERAGTVLGSGFLISGHIRNHHLCRKDDCEK